MGLRGYIGMDTIQSTLIMVVTQHSEVKRGWFERKESTHITVVTQLGVDPRQKVTVAGNSYHSCYSTHSVALS